MKLFINTAIHRVLMIALLAGFVSSQAGAQNMKQKAPIIVNGDKVEYFHEQKKVVGTGNVSIDYEDVKLTSEKVTVYLDTREAIAEGNVRITQKDAYFTGNKMNYNFDTKIGRAINTDISYVPFYGKADEFKKISENQINVQRSYITTCDLEKPHYRVKAKQVRIYLGDKVIAKHILFYVGDCPVMYLPYYVQPIKDRSSHITVMMGHDRDWGYYGLSSLKFDYSQLLKGRFRFDYRTKNGIAAGIDNNYSIPDLGEGVAKFYYADEDNDYLSYKPTGRNDGKYRLQIRHKWQVMDDTLFTMELNKVRDDNFMKYYFYKEWEEQQGPDSYVSIVKSAGEYTTTFLYRQRLDKYYTIVQRQPEYTIDIPKYNIKYFGKPTGLYYDLNLSAAFLNKTYQQVPPEIIKDERIERINAYNRLSYSTNPLKPFLRSLNITPYAGMFQTYYSRNRWGDTNFIRGAFDAGFDSQIKFYKVYDFNTNALWLDINNLRHIITPMANYYFMHQPTVDKDNLYQFDGIDGLAAQNHILFSVENKLQTKRDGTSVDLVDFIISTDYQFRIKKDVFSMFKNDDYKSRKFQSFDMQLELTPYPWLYTLAKMSVDTKYCLPKSASIDFVGGKEVDRSLAFGYRYERSFDPNVPSDSDTNKNITSYLTSDFIWKLNEFWKARVYWGMNMVKGYIEEHQYTLYRDLHCWTLEFTYDLRPYQNNKTIVDQIFWFTLRLKAFPDQPIGLRRTYSRTRGGRPGDPEFMERQQVGFVQ